MLKLRAVLVASVVLAIAVTGAAAQGVKNFNFCGGDNFQTCAAVRLTVGNFNASGVAVVTLDVVNLSGAGGISPAVFTGIALRNVPNIINAGGSTVLASSTGLQGTPTFTVSNGTALDLKLGGPDKTGIGNTCGASPATWNLWITGCSGTTNAVTFKFQVSAPTGTVWDVSGTEIAIRATNGQIDTEACTPNGGCSVSPEPVTMTLLGTGLLGLGGVNIVRRRRRGTDQSA